MSWVVVVSWSAALVFALILLGYCAHEIRWKLTRLRADLDSLATVQGEVTKLREQVETTGLRAQTLSAAPHHRR